MAILVTGGAGYIGSHTILQLLEADYDVVVLDNFSNSCAVSLARVKALAGKDFPFYEGDLCNTGLLRQIFTDQRITGVIHFAGLKAVGESVEKPLDYYNNNVSGTLNLLDRMKEFDVKNIVFSSSATVYGDPESVPIPETAKLHGTNPYGRSKWMIELILEDLCTSDPSWNVGILRYFNPVGAHSSGMIGEDPKGIPNNLVPYIAQVAVGKLSHLNVYGIDYPTVDGTGVRDYIHVEDLAKGHLLTWEKLQSNPGLVIYNLGTGQGHSVLEMIHGFEEASKKAIPYEVVDRRPGDIGTCYADTQRAQEALNFYPEKGVSRMLEDTWRWQQLNPKGYEEPILLVMAAGMGSRYGGLKQMDPVGPGGEFILDYSIYDALRAGFKKVVFIISAAMEEDFKEIVGNRWEDQLQLEYVIQEIHHVPEGATYRTDRKKPWGTGHAVLEAKDVINGPFAVINADDFYGPDTFKKLYQFMATQSRENTYGMVAFHLGQTVTEHGHVSRGICTLDEEGYLASVVERTEIYKDKDAIYYKDGEDMVMLHEETLVSMNTWTLTPSFMEELEKGFVQFLEAHGQEEKSEYFLPFVVDDLIQQGKVQVKVMETKEKWYGVTYHEDKDKVIQGIGKLIEEGIYPETLK